MRICGTPRDALPYSFGKHIDHSRKVCEGLRAAGIRAEHVDGTDSTARRDLVMNGLKTGGIDVVGNVALIDEGFDCQRCDVVMDGAPTKSVTRYLQRAGRAMAPCVCTRLRCLSWIWRATPTTLACPPTPANGHWKTARYLTARKAARSQGIARVATRCFGVGYAPTARTRNH